MTTDDTSGTGDVSIFDETLLASSQVRLFGRLFRGLKLDAGGLGALNDENRPQNGNPLIDKLDPK